MAYKSILVHCDAGKASRPRLEMAFRLGAQHRAHVAVLFAVDAFPAPSVTMPAHDQIREVQQRIREELRATAHASYEAARRATGFEQAEWRETAADALGQLALHARYADLTIIGQQEDDSTSGLDTRLQAELPLAAGRPVLVVPSIYRDAPVGRHALVAWNASREAARAVRDALPLLAGSSHVHVLTLGPAGPGNGHGEDPGADIALFLARHGLKVTVHRDATKGDDYGNRLLSRAFDLSADLIVMGAWGHSRLRERVLGGVTRKLLETMTVPVLMAH
jgi:nucleotide-binding universal stress UspA family protein